MSPIEIMRLVHRTLSGDSPRNLADTLMKRLVQVSFDPKGYEEWISIQHLGTRFEHYAKEPHLSIGVVVGFDLHWDRQPGLRLFTSIKSVADIDIDGLHLSEDGWSISFRFWKGEGWDVATIPAIVKLLDRLD